MAAQEARPPGCRAPELRTSRPRPEQPRRLLSRFVPCRPSIHPGHGRRGRHRVGRGAAEPRAYSGACSAADLFLPEPEPRAVRYTVISVDDHVVEPAHTFEGRLPAASGGPGAPHRRDARGAPGVGVRGRALHPGRDERGGRAPARDLRPGAVPLRPDAARLLRRRRPGARHGHQRRLGLGELPVHDHRLLRPCLLRRQGPRARPGLRAGLERLALRGVVLAAPRAHRPARHHVSGRPRPGRRRDPPQRRPRLHVGHLPRAAARDRAALAVGPGALGPDHGGRGRDGHASSRSTSAARA